MTTFEGKIDQLFQFFKGSAYTASFDLGLGADLTPVIGADFDIQNDTAARMTIGLVNWPTTDDFADAGSRTTLDFSAAAVVGIGGTAVKFAPPVFSESKILTASNPNAAYLITTAGDVLHNVWEVVRPPGPTPPQDPILTTPAEPGDIVAFTVSLELVPG